MSKKDFNPEDLIAGYFTSKGGKQEKPIPEPQRADKDDTGKPRVQKLPRINIAFTEDNLTYLQIVSQATGTSITQYVNDLIKADREGQDDLIHKMQALMREIKKK